MYIVLTSVRYIYICVVEPGYNDNGLTDTSYITTEVTWQQLIPHSLTITLHSSVTTFVYNDTECTVPFMAL